MYELTQDDYHIKCSESYIYTNVNGVNRAFYVDSIDYDHDDDIIFLSGTLYKGNETTIKTLPVDDVIIEYPPIGAFNLPSSAMSVYRLPVRQWREGMTSNNTHVIDPFVMEKSYLKMKTFRSIRNLSFLHNLYNNKMIKPHVLLKEVLDCKRLSGAFHSDWMIGWKMMADSPCLLYKELVVGPFNDNGVVTLNSNSSFLREEIESFGIEVEIK